MTVGFHKSIELAALLLDIVRNSHRPYHEKHRAKGRVAVLIDNVVSAFDRHSRRNQDILFHPGKPADLPPAHRSLNILAADSIRDHPANLCRAIDLPQGRFQCSLYFLCLNIAVDDQQDLPGFSFIFSDDQIDCLFGCRPQLQHALII